MKAYQDLVQTVLDFGEFREDRTGVGTRAMFGARFSVDLRHGFPLLTTKRIHWKSVVGELLWFLSGSTNAKELRDKYGVTIWDEWADATGDLGPVYGAQWRGKHDQIRTLITDLAVNPQSRRHIVSAWNVADLPHMALPPCHAFWQCYASNDKHLDLMLHQRSADLFLGVPFNTASYALLMHILGQSCGLKPRNLIMNFGDVHIYENHRDQVIEQLSRSPRQLPTVVVGHVAPPWDMSPDDIILVGYDPHPAITAPVAV